MTLARSITDKDWVGVRQAIARIGSLEFGPDSTPEFSSVKLTGLSASQFVFTDASKVLTSVAVPLTVNYGGTGLATLTDHSLLLGSGTDAVTMLGAATDGQLPIGSTGADPILAALTGTANQITVTNGAGSITLSTPQDIATGSSPTFVTIDLTGITDSNIPYMSASGFADSPLSYDGADVNLTAKLNSTASDDYGIDLSGGTWSSGVMNWDANPDVYSAGTKIIGFDDTNYNMFFGSDTFKTEAGQYNVAFGYQAGYYNTATGNDAWGDNNVYIGYHAGFGNVTGSTGFQNVAIGNEALKSVTSGNVNVAIGSGSLFLNTSGVRNMALGVNSLRSNLGGVDNIAIGAAALYTNSSGSTNTAIGAFALYYNTVFSNNIAIGNNAGFNVTGNANTFVGTGSGYYSTSANGNVYIGYKAGVRQTTGDNQLIIDNQDRSSAANEEAISLIYGTFAATAAAQNIRFNTATFNINGGVDTDITCNFIGTTNSGVLKWMEDEDYFEFDDDAVFVGDSVGLPYGDMYTNATIAVTISDNNPTEVFDATSDGFTAGELHRVTFPTGGDEHYLSVDVAGRYLITWSNSFAQNSPSSAIEVEGGVMVGGVAQNPGRAHRTVANSTDKGNMGGVCILDLAANAQVSLFITNETNTTNIDVEHANLTLVHIGGT